MTMNYQYFFQNIIPNKNASAIKTRGLKITVFHCYMKVMFLSSIVGMNILIVQIHVCDYGSVHIFVRVVHKETNSMMNEYVMFQINPCTMSIYVSD